MKIADYCAIKAYKFYTENNKNIESKENFISSFSTDLTKKINVYLKDYKENKETIKKALTVILRTQFDNLHENNIIDSSGQINVTAIQTNLDAAVQKDYPEIYEKAVQVRQMKIQKEEENTNKDSSNKIVNFNNPEEKKAFFNNLINEYSNLKTEQEKETFKRSNFADYDTYKKEIDSYLTYKNRMKELKEKNPEMTHKERSKQVREELGQTKEETTFNIKIAENSAQIAELSKEYANLKNKKSTEAQKIKKQISDLKHENKQLSFENNSNKKQFSLEYKNYNTNNTSINMEEINKVFEIEDNNISESSNSQMQKITDGQLNPFGMFISDLNQQEADNTNDKTENALIEMPRKNLFNRLKNAVSNIRKNISGRITDITKSLSSLIKRKPEIPALNTAENNTHSHTDYVEISSTLDNIIVSPEEQAKNQALNKISQNKGKSKTSIQTSNSLEL